MIQRLLPPTLVKHISYGGVPMNAGVVYGDARGVKYVGPRQILYSYIYDITISDMKNAYIATSIFNPVMAWCCNKAYRP